jgi:hypothetical protein
MSPEEFIPIAADMQARWWAFKIPATALDQYVRDLCDLDVDKVRAAVVSLGAEGRERPPTSGQIRRRVAEMELDAPSWDEARTALLRWRRAAAGRVDSEWACPAERCDGSAWVAVDDRGVTRMAHCECWDAFLAARRGYDTLPALLAEFVAESHVAAGELDRIFAVGDTTAEAQLRQRWQQFCDRAIESRVLAGLPHVDLTRIHAARVEDTDRRERSGELRHLGGGNVVALLERETETETAA